jgi:hypothetical protein
VEDRSFESALQELQKSGLKYALPKCLERAAKEHRASKRAADCVGCVSEEQACLWAEEQAVYWHKNRVYLVEEQEFLPEGKGMIAFMFSWKGTPNLPTTTHCGVC